jgi:hypothetical protein
MSDEKITDLIPELMRNLRNDILDLKRELRTFREDSRAGFASVNHRLDGLQSDMRNVDRRFDNMQDDIDRLTHQVEFPNNDQFDA